MVEGKVSKTRNSFTIPVFPHVKKFIVKNTRACGIIKVEEGTTLGKIVTLSLLSPGSKNSDACGDRTTATITLMLSKRQIELGARISNLSRVNIYIDRVFKAHLLTSIYSLSGVGIPPYQACKMFLERYNINQSEYSAHAAYRFYQRAKTEH